MTIDNSSIDKQDIQDLFDRVAEHFKDADEGARAMFAMLVETALRYRDELERDSEDALNVGETREALDAFMQVLRTQQFPEGLEKRVHDLVMQWLEEIKKQVHH